MNYYGFKNLEFSAPIFFHIFLHFLSKPYIELPVGGLGPQLHAQLPTDGRYGLEVSKILGHVLLLAIISLIMSH